MCGIAGCRTTIADEAHVTRQLALLEHRGPDSSGVFGAGGGVVGQTRLSIIDLKTGDPPIFGCDRSVSVVLNGEIYNYRQLRGELEGRGHRLSTHGDTEVIAHLYEELDAAALASRLTGMFAFGVWDSARQRLTLGRDRFGKKPLYYWSGSNGEVVFASEIKALLSHPEVPRRLDPDALSAYLTFGYVPTPNTFFEGVRSLPPGHVLVADADGVRTERYWSLGRAEGAAPVSFGDAATEVRRRLQAAVERRMIADVPVGAFLSGGVDSSAVVAVMANASTRPVRTFTIGFEDSAGFDERPYARQVAELYGTDHTEFVVDPDKAELIERLVWHHDQPFGDSSALPTYLLSELTASEVTVALSGDGGDEAFAGYERFAAGVASYWLFRLPAPIRSGAVQAIGSLPPRTPRKDSLRRLVNGGSDPLTAYRSWISYVPSTWKSRLLPAATDWAEDGYERAWAATAGRSPLKRLLHLNIDTYLLDDLLPKVDRMAMAHGLEVRSPFLDPEIVDYALSLPDRYLIRPPFLLKHVLKKALEHDLPNDILHRRKRGFGIPLDRWFRTDLRPYAEGLLSSRESRIADHLEMTQVAALLSAHIAGTENLGHAVWTLVTLELFLRQQGW